MKNIIFKIFFLVLTTLLFNACQERELETLNPDANTDITLSQTALVLNEDTPDADALVVNWTEPDFGFDAAPTYSVLIDLATGDFSEPQSVAVGNVYTKTFTTTELNSKLLALGAEPDEINNIAFKIEVKLSDYKKIISPAKTINITPFASILDLSTNWGVVGSATPGGWGTPNLPDVPFWTTTTAGVLVSYVTLKDGEIKFRTNNSWATNLGDNGNDGSLEAEGANIPVTAGTYKITFNLNNNTYTIVPFSYGIVGSGVTNGWGAPDTKLYYNSYADDWRAVVTLVNGEIKFRLNESWDNANTFGLGSSEGVLVHPGANIPVTAGHYLIKFNPVTMEYAIEPINVWGLVGSATPNGWDGPDVKFTPDFGLTPDVYYINGVVLTTGEIKIRKNDQWTVNYGDNGNDGTLEIEGANIPVTAGKYNIKVDMSTATPTITKVLWP